MLKVTAWYCNDCGGNFLPSGEEPVTCTCEPGAQRFNYSVGNGASVEVFTPEKVQDVLAKYPDSQIKDSFRSLAGHGGFPDYPRTDVLQGGDLDIRAREQAITRQWGEDDASLRARIKKAMMGGYEADPHAGHEIIENYAGGKAFKYCRKCKVEV